MNMFIIYGFMVVIIVLLSVQLHLTKKLLETNGQNDDNGLDDEESATVQHEDEKSNEGGEHSKLPRDKRDKNEIEKHKSDGKKKRVPNDKGEGELVQPDNKKGTDNPLRGEEEKKSCKEKVLDAICERKKIISEEDLPRVEAELLDYFSKNATTDYYRDLNSKDYYRFIDLRNNPTARVVVVGDIHCDFLSLAAVLLKLSVSDFDYFNKAYFVFLGDYLDRGRNLFELLLLLMDLKNILGERMIMLKGNHESLEWNDKTKKLNALVRPHESSECLNEYCAGNTQFLKEFSHFYSTLPVYVYLKTSDRNVLLTHAAVPRDVFLNTVKFNETDGTMVFSSEIPTSERLSQRNSILKDMIWGDPSTYEEKYQTDGRFEFGSKQFEQWVSSNHIDLMFRSHEETPRGYREFFENRLFTIFSTGGKDNDHSHYKGVEPAFAVIQNDRFFIENSYIFNVKKGEELHCINMLNKQSYTAKQAENYKLEKEFLCDEETGRRVRGVFKTLLEESSSEKE